MVFNFLFSVSQQQERDASPHPANIHPPHTSSSHLRKTQTQPLRDASAKAARASGQAFIGTAKLRTPGGPSAAAGLLRSRCRPRPQLPCLPRRSLGGEGPLRKPPLTFSPLVPEMRRGVVCAPGEKTAPFLGIGMVKINISPVGEWGTSESGSQGHSCRESILIS